MSKLQLDSMDMSILPESHEVRTRNSSETRNHTQDGAPEFADELSRGNTAVIILAVTCSTFISAIVNGMFSVAIPTISNDVGLSQSLLLWPQSIVSLVSACTLLIAGAVSDVIGNKLVYVLGSLLQACFILGAGVSGSGTQLLVFRGGMGLAQSMCLPTSVSLIAQSLPAGRRRNIGFACMGGGQPLGFSIGLLLGGVFASTIGWRVGMYLVAGLNAVVVMIAGFGLPANRSQPTLSLLRTLKRIRAEVDWIGALLISIALGFLSYVLG